MHVCIHRHTHRHTHTHTQTYTYALSLWQHCSKISNTFLIPVFNEKKSSSSTRARATISVCIVPKRPQNPTDLQICQSLQKLCKMIQNTWHICKYVNRFRNVYSNLNYWVSQCVLGTMYSPASSPYAYKWATAILIIIEGHKTAFNGF